MSNLENAAPAEDPKKQTPPAAPEAASGAPTAGSGESSTPLSAANLQQHNTNYGGANQSGHQNSQSGHHAGTGSHTGAHGQRYNKNYNRQANNSHKTPYNKRNHGNKMNHHPNQYNNYNNQAAAAAAYNNYYYYGYQNYYPMMNPMGVYGQPNASPQPSMASPTTMYNGLNSGSGNSPASPNSGFVQPNVSPSGSVPGAPGSGLTPQGIPAIPQGSLSPTASFKPMSPGKIKITDRDGKQIDLEEKKKQLQKSSSATPITSPRAGVASPVKNYTPLASKSPIVNKPIINPPAPVPAQAPVPAPAQVPTPAAPVTKAPAAPAVAPGSKSAIDDFKERVKLLAQKAKQKENPEKKEEPKKEPVPKEEPAPVKEAPVKEASPVKEAPVKEAPVKEVAPVKEEPVKEEPKEETLVKEPAPVKEEPKEEPVKEESAAPEVTKSDVKDSENEDNDNDNDHDTTKTNEDEEDEDDEDGEEEDDGPHMDLSQFFERLKTVEALADPMSTKYPEPFVGVDAKWKSETKKFRYDPQFLIQFKDVVQYTVDEEWKNKLAGLGIVAQKNDFKRYNSGNGMQRGGSSRGGGFSNRFNQLPGRGGQFDPRQNSRNGSKRKGGSSRDNKSKRGNQSKRKDREEDMNKGITIPPEEIKPLEKTANRWVPRSKAKAEEVKLAPDGVTPILSEEDIERKVKSLLNKLTLEMFEPITDDILKIMEQSKWEDDAKTVRQVINLTFAKACDEPYWSSMYAQFCAKMCTRIPPEVSFKEGEVVKSGGDLARRLLLATCQREYEKGWSDKVSIAENDGPLEMMSDEYYAMAAAKRRGLGLIKFIGQLYLLNMLNDKVIMVCLSNLSKNVEDPSEESIESLAQLVTAIGPKFEQGDRSKAFIQVIFDNIQKILDKVKLSSRIKFMLMDLQDLRSANWVSHEKNQGPKTIKEIHDDAELKRMEDEKAAIERRRKNKGGQDPRSNSSRGASQWGSQPRRVESSSKIPQTKDAKGFQSVSRSQSNRGGNDSSSQFNSLSPRENSKRTESLQSATNMFAALGGEGENDGDGDSEGEKQDHQPQPQDSSV